MIPVTKSFLPPIEEYTAQVQRSFDNGWLTNRGELVVELEEKLTNYLDLKESKILCTNNGTIPLQIALKLLGKGGEIITTPFSYVATTAAIVWENCTPVFVDIDPKYLTIDEDKIEAAITEKTTCILATHVFGNPCNIEEIDRIAKKHNLKVIYDAAHCFGVKYKGKSIFEYGDISTCSFHATKIFQTGEGGASFTKDKKLFNQILYSHSFGHKYQYEFHGLGINGKMNELNAAMGLSVLPYMDEVISARKTIYNNYKNNLPLNISMVEFKNIDNWNYSYLPIVFKDENELLISVRKLEMLNIYARRYFYPSLNTLKFLTKEIQNTLIAEDISKRILCLPFFYGLNEKDILLICSQIKQ